jgi:hypothetical protein
MAEKNELIVDVKGTEKESTNEVELVGLRLFSLNRYQDCNSTRVCSCWDQWSTWGPEVLKTHLSVCFTQVNCVVWQVKFRVTSVICQMDLRGLGCARYLVLDECRIKEI